MIKFYLPILLLLPVSAQAATYYMRQDGSAANKEAATSCSASSTSMSVTTHNAETFSAGDTVVLCDETVFTSTIEMIANGSTGNYITYDGDYDNDGIDAEVQGGVSRLLQQRTYLKFQDIKFTTSVKGIQLGAGPQNIWVTNCEFNGLTQQGIYGNGATDTAYAEDWLIENSTFINIGISSDSASADINPTGFARQWTVRNTTHTGNGTNGVDGLVVSINNVAGADGSGFIVDGMTCSGYYENCVDFKGIAESPANEGQSIVRNSVMSGSTGSEALLNIHYNSTGILIEKTKFLDTSANALSLVGHGATYDAVGRVSVRNCLFSAVAKGIFTDTGLVDDEAVGGNSFYNNTMINSGQTISGYSIDIGSNNNTFKNNIFYRSSQNASSDMIFRFSLEAFYTSAVMDYNAYKKLDEANYALVNVVGVGYPTLAQLQAAGKETHGYYVDPLLDSQGRPTAKSPGNEAGTFAFDGQKYAGKYPAIGAYDHNAGISTPWNIALSISGGPTSLGSGGRTYNVSSGTFYLIDGSNTLVDGANNLTDGGL